MSSRFDDLSRILASQLPRRESLKLAARVLAGGVASLALPGSPIRPALAWARNAGPSGVPIVAPEADPDLPCPICGPVSVRNGVATQIIFGPIAELALVRAVNCEVRVSPPGSPPEGLAGSSTSDPLEPGQHVIYDPPENQVTVEARRLIANRSASVTVDVANRTGIIPGEDPDPLSDEGCVVRCDPIDLNLHAGERWGSMKILTGVPDVESKVLILNLTPGLRALTLVVNGRRFRLRGLRDGEELTADVASAMRPGDTNEFVLIAEGPPGSNAHLLIWDGGSPQAGAHALRHGRVGLLSVTR